MQLPTLPLAWKIVEVAKYEQGNRYNDQFKEIFRQLRIYSAGSVVDAALRRLARPYASVIEELQSFPWLTLLLVKWSLRDGNINLWVGRRISDQEFELLLQAVWNLQDSGYRISPTSNVFLMMRGILPAQLDFQRPANWGFLRWPALLEQQPKENRARRLFTEEFKVEPADFMDLGLALHGVFLERQKSIRSQWFNPLRPTYGSAVDRVVESVSRNLIALRAELQSDQALKNRGRHELVEFPYLKRFPIVRMRDSSLRCWHPTVFSRGMEEIVHLRLGAHGADYTEPFSKLFEQYVVDLIAATGCRMVTEKQQWEAFGRDATAIEAILPFDRCTVFVEAKLGLFGDEVLHTDNEVTVHEKTKVLREAARKAAKVADAIRRTPTSLLNCPATPENFLIVVTSRELYVSGGEQLERLYLKGQHVFDKPESDSLISLSNIFYVSIDEFEKLIGCVEAEMIHLPDFLREAAQLNRLPEKARPFLTDHLRGYVQKWSVPKLIRDARARSEARLMKALGGH